MAASSSSKGLTERKFDYKWEIQNWETISGNLFLIERTKTEIECKVDNVVLAKFVVGLEVVHYVNYQCVRLYWELIENHLSFDSVDAALSFELNYRDGTRWMQSKSEANAAIGKVIFIPYDIWNLSLAYDFTRVTSPEGSLTIKFQLTLKNLPDIVGKAKEQEFRLASKNEFSQNMLALVNNKSSSDVKFHTKDNTKVFAHKAILCAQCPVFSSMFGSEFLESSTGLVKVDDISSKTMKILLSYWYTGELLPSWKDDDTIVEFTYAAGKYQMTQVLKLLDDLLKLDENDSDKDVELLRMVHQLSLKNAESRILKLVIDKVNQAKNAAELLNLFSLTTDNFDEGKFTFSQVLKAFDDVLSDNNVKEASSQDLELMALASKNGMTNVETKLLQRVIDTINKLGSAEKLFALFDIQVDKKDEGSESGDLLVRVNPT